jgi:hypothetical protein
VGDAAKQVSLSLKKGGGLSLHLPWTPETDKGKFNFYK